MRAAVCGESCGDQAGLTADAARLEAGSAAMWMNFSMSSSGVTILGDDLMPGPKRNFQIFDPLSRACGMAEVTQHIPEIGEHQIRYYGWYSNKKRGQRAKAEPAVAVVEPKDDGEKPLAPGDKQARKR